jgi:hypothetical protein
MFSSKAAKSVQAHHLSVVVHNLRDHAHRVQTGKPAQVHGRFGVARTLTHSTVNGAKGENMPGTGD